ncbi:hypothetical protein EJB05_50591, partial [Eragrostis curvula]
MTPPRRLLPAVLMEELVEDILLRFPPADPARLFRAAVVCKCWRRLICSRDFRRRFREFHHRTLPLLGLIYRFRTIPGSWIEKTYFMPTSFTFRRLPSSASISDWNAIDTLHGRILFWDPAGVPLTVSPEGPPLKHFIVWSPSGVRMLPLMTLNAYTWSAALVCATAGCDHLDCTSSGAFFVIFVGKDATTTSAYVYSSEQDAWSEPVTMEDRRRDVSCVRHPGPVVGNIVYFTCLGSIEKLLAYNLSKQQLSFISLPACIDYFNSVLITVDEGKKLGFATALESKLSTWSRDDAGVHDGDAVWIQHRVFVFDKLLPSCKLSYRYHLFAATDNPGVIVVRGQDVLFILDLKSGGATKLLEGSAHSSILDIVPYICFYIPTTHGNL